MGPIAGIVGMILIIIGVFFLNAMIFSMDGNRIDDSIRQRGGRLLRKSWNPFGAGWLGHKSARFYDVTYEDEKGNLHEATCKTNLWTGVHFTKDQIVKYNSNPV